MHPPELLTSSAPPPLAEPAVATEREERRRPAIATFDFTPDPRRLRALLAEVDQKLTGGECRQRRRIRLLIAEIVSRLISTSPRAEIHLTVEQKANSLRLDVWQDGVGPCEFFEHIEEAVFLDLASVWGRERRRPCGAWFEVL